MWKSIRSLLSQPADESVSLLKIPQAHVYFDKITFYVTAHVACEDRRGGPRLPVQSFDRLPDAGVIGKVLAELLRKESPVVSPDEFDKECEKAFDLLNVGGFEELESQYWYLPVWVDAENMVIFSPTRKSENGGYVGVGDRQKVPIADTSRLGETARELILSQNEIAVADVDESSVGDDRSGYSAAAEAEFMAIEVGDRVEDSWGNQGVVTEVNPTAEHGMGVIRVQHDDGRENVYSFVAPGLEKLA